MKKIAISFLMLALLSASCTSKKDSGNEIGETIDSSVVGKDTSPLDVRKDINLSDPEKQSVPGRSKDSASDENKTN